MVHVTVALCLTLLTLAAPLLAMAFALGADGLHPIQAACAGMAAALFAVALLSLHHGRRRNDPSRFDVMLSVWSAAVLCVWLASLSWRA